MQHVVPQPRASKRDLQRNRRLVPGIARAVPVSRDIRRVRRHNQAVFPALDPSLIRAVGESEVDQPGHEKHQPFRAPTYVSFLRKGVLCIEE